MTRRTVLGWGLVLLSTGILLAHAHYYLPFLSDDALISFRYADRLLAGDGLTWTEGRPVEGYSNLLWVLLLAGAGAAGVDLVDASRILGVLGMLTAMGAVAGYYLVVSRRRGALVGAAAGLIFFASAAPIAVWAVGGLEQPLVAAALAGVFPLYWRAAEGGFRDRRLALGLAVLLGALCLTRPDGPLFTVAVLAALALDRWTGDRGVGRRWPWAFLLIVLAGPVLCGGGQLAFRLAYYGAWVPNTALVKLSPSSHHTLHGLWYAARGVLALAPASLLILWIAVVGLARRTSRSRFLPLATTATLWIAYLVVIGGDIFPAHRHFVPLVIVATYVLAEGASAAWEKWRERRGTVAGVVTATLALTIVVQFVHIENRRAVAERWEWEGRALALTLKAAFEDEQPLLAVTAAGSIPYWAELPALDLLGLNDYYLPRHKPPDAGSGILGHELGDGDYLLRRAPDLVVFGVGSEPNFRYEHDFAEDDRFEGAYAPMPVQTAMPPVYEPLVWFRKDSESLGIQHHDDHVRIPAYFLNSLDHTTARLVDGRLVVSVDAERPAAVDLPRLEGRWTVEVLGSHVAPITPTVQPRGDSVRVTLTTTSPTPLPIVAIELRARREGVTPQRSTVSD